MIACALMAVAIARPSMASDLDRSSNNTMAIAEASGPVEPAPGKTLRELVEARADTVAPNADQECIAAAVYFEARGEPIEGQLAVASVVLNRAASGRYPASICAVVTQAAQFSFVRQGKIPPIARATEAWRKALAIAHVAVERLVQQIDSNVLWYHANYVRPAWGRRLLRVTQIGTHIFYSGNG
jgi:spore germination cell wall hydrolase CwlJ-like protein